MKNKTDVKIKTEGMYILMIHDSDGDVPCVYLFPDLESAKDELKAIYLEDLRVEKEENGRTDEDMVTDFDEENGLWAVIRVRQDIADEMWSGYYTIMPASKPGYKVTLNHYVCGSVGYIEKDEGGVWTDVFNVPEGEGEMCEGMYSQTKTFYSKEAALEFCSTNRIGPVDEVNSLIDCFSLKRCGLIY